MGTNTGIGIGIGIPFRNNALGGDNIYFPPELKARMIGVWDNYGKKNTDADRNIIKNKIPNAGGDLEILNSAYKLNSGFGKYEVDFTSWIQTDGVIASSDKVQNSIVGRFLYFNTVNKKEDVPSFKVNITLGQQSKLQYNYIKEDGTSTYIVYSESGIYTIPASYFSKYTGGNAWFGFYQIEGTSIIEQIPSFEGALVTDGINDIIASIKTLEEWNIGDKGITIVSMIHQINTNSNNFITTNNFRTTNRVVGRNIVSNIEKTGIYGWYKENIQKEDINIINNILGDKNDYIAYSSPSTNTTPINSSKFYVTGYVVENGFSEISSIAHYWTFAVLDKATEDEINLIIAKYNLDRTLRPDILCNITKQGITNDNHAEFNDKLIDYSGNGRDIQMNNLAWKGDSGIGKYETDFLDSSIWKYKTNSSVTSDKIVCNKAATHIMLLYYSITDENKYDVPSFNVLKQGDASEYYYIDEQGTRRTFKLLDGINTLPASHGTLFTGTEATCGFGNPGIGNSVTITQIPSHAGGLCLDGVNDFGKVTGMPIYKDYTFIIDREIISIGDTNGIVASKSEDSTDVNKQGAFLFEYLGSPNNVSAWSFYKDNGKVANTDFTRGISYQSKYSYNGTELLAGTAFDSDKLWLGTLRDKDSRFANVAIYSLMSFPYSMSEFLIERQLKKHKLGTLYPDMVEFRPVIKSNVLLDAKPTFVIRGTSTYLNAGDYVPENSRIWVSIKMNNIADRITKFTVNGKTIDIPENAYSEVTLQYGFPFVIDKSPQKISITIEQDENYVKFEPVITSNVEYVRLDFYLNNYQKRINIGDYIPKDVYLRANFYLKNNVDELTVFTFNGVNIGYRRSSADDTAFNIGQIYNYDSPQEVNITIDEYIRYEHIVQPYPVLLRFKDENGNEVSWGGKFKVGSTITRIGSAADSNLLPNIYNIFGLLLNDNQVTSSKVIVEKTMVFKAKSAYIFDNNEPKCILSPSRLRIPNSSYKILGYIPDISGHGNHGKINNSAYAGASGANGYLQNFSGWTKASGVSSTDSVISSSNNLVAANAWIAYVTSGTVIPTFKVEISGIPVNGNLRFEGSDQTLVNGVNTIQGITTTKVSGFYISSGYDNDWSNLKIEQIGEYEGAYCFDGVDDFVTIPTTVGGKQVLMKVNWQSIAGTAILYDQRTNGGFAIFNRDFDANENKVSAYRARNTGGSTYIDGILNEYIYASQLKNITHNIVELYNPELNIGTLNPKIGGSYLNSNYAQMSLYDFMLFDNISTDDKIKELNEYVGIEAKVELPPYYWDAYGKTNLDADKATIQQRGVAVGDYDLTNNNLVYDNMSGFGGYTLGKFTNSWSLSNNSNSISIVARNPYDITLKKLGGNSDWEFNTTELKIISNPVSVKFKSDKNIRFTCDYHYYTVGGNSEGAPLGITSKDLIANEDTIITISPISQENIGKYNIDINRGYYLIYFQLSLTLAVNEEVTIEMLPLYPNGLVLDGVDDYLINKNIPAFTDFTYILKRELLTNTVDTGSVFKGTKYAAGGWAFIADYYNSNSKTTGYSFGNTVSYTTNEKTIYGTKTSVNGNTIVPGPNVDELGITLGKWSSAGYRKMVFYKLMLYPKTIPLLQINFLKNLMERDEIIDLTNPIFIKNE